MRQRRASTIDRICREDLGGDGFGFEYFYNANLAKSLRDGRPLYPGVARAVINVPNPYRFWDRVESLAPTNERAKQLCSVTFLPRILNVEAPVWSAGERFHEPSKFPVDYCSWLVNAARHIFGRRARVSVAIAFDRITYGRHTPLNLFEL